MKYLPIIFTAFILVFFKKLEDGFLTIHFSWMISKSLPYFLLIIGGILISFNFKNLIKNTYIKWIFILVVTFLPFVIGFSMHPIYQGDFSLTEKK